MGNMMKLWKTLMWVAAVPIFGLQALALYAMNDAKNRGNIDMALFPAVAAIVLLLAAMILVCALKEKKGIAVILSLVSGVFFGIFAGAVHNVYSYQFQVESVNEAMTTWDFVSRHVSPFWVILLLVFYWICWRAEWKAEQARKEAGEPDHYIDLSDFSMSPIDE